MSGLNISIDEAKQDKLFYVVANIAIVNPQDSTCLLLKRGADEKVLPGKWSFPGGKLEHGDIAALLNSEQRVPIEGIDDILGKLAAREAQEECGLTVTGIGTKMLKNKVFVRPDGIPVFMVTLATSYAGGDVVIEEGAFSDYRWIKEDELDDYDCIEGVNGEAKKALASPSDS